MLINIISYLYSISEIASFSFRKELCSSGIALISLGWLKAGLIKAALTLSSSSIISLTIGETFTPLIFRAILIIPRALYVIPISSNCILPLFFNIESRLEPSSCKLYFVNNFCIADNHSVTSRSALLCRLLLPVNELNVYNKLSSMPTLALYQG